MPQPFYVIGCGALGVTQEAMSLFSPYPAFSVDVYHKSSGYSVSSCDCQVQVKALVPLSEGRLLSPEAQLTL